MGESAVTTTLLSELDALNNFYASIELLTNKKTDQNSLDFMLNTISNNFFDQWLISNLISKLLPLLETSRKPYEKERALTLLDSIIQQYSAQIKFSMIELIPVVSNLFWDTKISVQQLAKTVLGSLIKSSGNHDLDPFLPIVLESFEDPNTIPDAVEKLAGCVFVQNIECAAIAIIEPILNRGLRDKTNEVKRKACVIIDNMCKLVEHPKEILPFKNKIQPLIESCAENISDPEARSMATKSLNTLKNAYGTATTIVSKTNIELLDIIKTSVTTYILTPFICTLDDMKILSQITANLCNAGNFEYELWCYYFARYIKISDKAVVVNITKYVLNRVEVECSVKDEVFVDEEEGLDLYKGTFSLAYGALTLLNGVNIHLKRNRFYGLLGPNNCGKTTLMRAIANEQIEGFPKRDELRTIFVEHEIQERVVGEDAVGYDILNTELNGIEWILDCCNYVYKMEPAVEREAVEQVMEELGFGNSKKGIGKDRAADATMQVTTYSGGWKMKMQLCAATLMNADILMLDEPTGHLDVTNIAWIKAWLKTFIDNGGSVITTSHETSFLNEMCTHIIDFQNRKLTYF